MKICPPALLAIVLLANIGLHARAISEKSSFNVPPTFDLGSAMSGLFGNYDPRTDSSNYDIPQTTVLDLRGSGFEIGDDIVVQPFWAEQTAENGTSKVVLLTFSVPKASFGKQENAPGSFNCHACAPLIGAAVFAYRGGKWQVESSRTVISEAGVWGDPPTDVRIVRIGPQRIGIEMTISDMHGGESTSFKIIMVPWNGKVNEALSYGASDENKGDCGNEEDELPCFASRTVLRFEPGADMEYHHIRLTLSGTRLGDVAPYSTRPARGSELLAFRDGYYQILEHKGRRISTEHSIGSSR